MSNEKYFVALIFFMAFIVVGLLFVVPAFGFLGAIGNAIGWLIALLLGAFVALMIVKKG